jgi:hypothetical protein
MAERTILFMHDDGYGVQSLLGAEDVAGGFRGYRPYWQAGGCPGGDQDFRFWTVWERVDGSPEIRPCVVDDFGNLRSGKAVRLVAQGGHAGAWTPDMLSRIDEMKANRAEAEAENAAALLRGSTQ